MDPLPIDPYVPDIATALATARAAVVVAEPGAGKTTRVPPALALEGPVLLLQPRRAAARAIAQRIAFERGWTIGREVGWHVRLEQRFTPSTRLIVATEGILTARLQQDPLLSSFRTIILDEFHERSVHADLGIALTKQAWRARDDLQILVMSATLDADRVARFLDDCPIVRVPGRTHPVTIEYHSTQSPADACVDLLRHSTGVLCFLPGAFEIQQTVNDVRARIDRTVDVVPLHGSINSEAQDRALNPTTGQRRVIVATNIAETSVTVPGVTAVVDSGLQKVARYDAARAIDSLVTERVTLDAADQRAGRAGRTAPGLARRLWDAHDRLRPHREPDIHRIDLSNTVLNVLAWGGNPFELEWFEAPRRESIEAALHLLERLGAVAGPAGAGPKLTDVGRQMQTLPIHPRLGRILLAGTGDRKVVRACAMLSERLLLPPRLHSTSSDLLSAIDRWEEMPPHVHQVARDIERLVRNSSNGLSDDGFRAAILAGYPDRVAQRRDVNSARMKLSSGTGAALAATSGVKDGEFMVAVDLRTSTRPHDSDSIIHIASLVDRDWLTPTDHELVHRLDESGSVRAVEIDCYDALVLKERTVKADDEIASRLLSEAWLAGKRSNSDRRILQRLKFAGIDVRLDDLIVEAARGLKSLADIRLDGALPYAVLQALNKLAPERLDVPSGRTVALEYHDDGTVSASVKLQEVFGLAETPRIGPRSEPVVFSLLAPNGRPVQVTRDLRSFWNRTYPEVRKELRGRYPRHPWPDDPWTATPTARTKRGGTMN